jgi:excisionase family DNA binding protein
VIAPARLIWPGHFLFFVKKSSPQTVFTLMRSPCTHQQHAAPRLLYDRKEAARQLSISVRSLDYLIAGKKLRIVRLGKKVLIPHAELVRFAAANHYEAMTLDGRSEAA